MSFKTHECITMVDTEELPMEEIHAWEHLELNIESKMPRNEEEKSKIFECHLCEKTFAYMSRLKRHLRTRHEGCNICGKKFSTSSNKKRHMKTHTGEKSYACDLCGKTFTQDTGRKKHMMLHTGEKPYECQLCNKRFNRPDNLKGHMKVHRSS